MERRVKKGSHPGEHMRACAMQQHAGRALLSVNGPVKQQPPCPTHLQDRHRVGDVEEGAGLVLRSQPGKEGKQGLRCQGACTAPCTATCTAAALQCQRLRVALRLQDPQAVHEAGEGGQKVAGVAAKQEERHGGGSCQTVD